MCAGLCIPTVKECVGPYSQTVNSVLVITPLLCHPSVPGRKVMCHSCHFWIVKSVLVSSPNRTKSVLVMTPRQKRCLGFLSH